MKFKRLLEAEAQYPFKGMGDLRYKRDKMIEQDEFEVTVPSFTIKYKVKGGHQYDPSSNDRPSFSRDSKAEFEAINQDEVRAFSELVSKSIKQQLAELGYEDVDTHTSAQVGITIEGTIY